MYRRVSAPSPKTAICTESGLAPWTNRVGPDDVSHP